MKKRICKKWLIAIATALFIVTTVVALLIKYSLVYDKSNLFAYTIDLENENWAYAPKGLDYGMTSEEVIKADRLKNYIWEVENEVLRIEKTVKKPFSEVKELDYVKRYFFDSDGELASVRYEMRMDTEYEHMMRQLLFVQATAYMPEINKKTDLEGLLDSEKFPLYGPWNKVMVWEDTVYTDDSTKVQTHANSDVVLRIGRPYVTGENILEDLLQEDIVISLTVSRYMDRLSQEEIEALREDYPIINVEIWPSMAPITMEVCMWKAETFVHGIHMGEEVVYDDRGRYVHNAQILEVIEDKEKMLSAKEEIISPYNRNMMAFDKMSGEGKLKIVAPAYRYDGEWVFDKFGLFYVTEDGYVIASYDEDNMFGRVYESALSGLTLEDFMRKVKK